MNAETFEAFFRERGWRHAELGGGFQSTCEDGSSLLVKDLGDDRWELTFSVPSPRSSITFELCAEHPEDLRNAVASLPTRLTFSNHETTLRGLCASFTDAAVVWEDNLDGDAIMGGEGAPSGKPHGEPTQAELDFPPFPPAAVAQAIAALEAAGWEDPLAGMKKSAALNGSGIVRDCYPNDVRLSCEIHVEQHHVRLHLLRASDEAGLTLVVGPGEALAAWTDALVRTGVVITAENLRGAVASLHALVPELTFLETEAGLVPLQA